MLFFVLFVKPLTQYTHILQALCYKLMQLCFVVILGQFRASNYSPILWNDFFPNGKKKKKKKNFTDWL